MRRSLLKPAPCLAIAFEFLAHCVTGGGAALRSVGGAPRCTPSRWWNPYFGKNNIDKLSGAAGFSEPTTATSTGCTDGEQLGRATDFASPLARFPPPRRIKWWRTMVGQPTLGTRRFVGPKYPIFLTLVVSQGCGDGWSHRLGGRATYLFRWRLWPNTNSS